MWPVLSLQRGEINWERCEKFLKQIAKYEQDMLSTMPPLHLEVLEQSLQSDNEEEEGTRTLRTRRNLFFYKKKQFL